MKDEHRSHESLFEGLRPPAPPPELREHVLSRAREALARPLPPDRWTLIWGSPGLRLAWSFAVVVLVLFNLLIPQRRQAGAGPSALPLSVSVREGGDELAAVATLPRIDLDARSPGVTAPAPPSALETPVPQRPLVSNQKETSS